MSDNAVSRPLTSELTTIRSGRRVGRFPISRFYAPWVPCSCRNCTLTAGVYADVMTLAAFLVVPLFFTQSIGTGSDRGEPVDSRVDQCQEAGARLSARQMKRRLSTTVPITSGMLSHLRIGNAVVSFRLRVDQSGAITCIHTISGHPIILAATIESLKRWTFHPLVSRGHATPFTGPLVIRVSTTRQGFVAAVLDAVPPAE